MARLDIDAELREDVRLLGNFLGDTLKQQVGQQLFDQVEDIRKYAKGARDGDHNAEQQLAQILQQLTDEDALPLSRAFSQFLNFANIAEQYHVERMRREQQCNPALSDSNDLPHLFQLFAQNNITGEQLYQQICDLHIELVLTAHPTEVSRRTLIEKYDDISTCLAKLDQHKLTPIEHDELLAHLRQEITAVWQTDEIRQKRPTPVDEAKSGFTTIEQTLWHAIPKFMRALDKLTLQHCQKRLPIDLVPVRFASWMGGDRDGNPNVTHGITEQVLLLSRRKAASLLLDNLSRLRWELSMQQCSPELAAQVNNHVEPYRERLRELRDRLQFTLSWLDAKLAGQNVVDSPMLLQSTDELLTPLKDCYHSLVASKMQDIADGQLLDFIRQASCFGIQLLKLDIRQESNRHRQALSAITAYLGLGEFGTWSEQSKQTWLMQELVNKRPLLPQNIDLKNNDALNDADVQEVLNTFKVLAQQPSESLGAYIISMAQYPSDVLAVMLLQKEAGIAKPLRVVPLFETLDDLDGAADTIDQLLSMPWYKQAIQGKQEVMIGYSDSAKDAGFMSANWAQYRAQEQLTDVSQKHSVQLTLFHGRGGSISRGGAPTHQALYAQPPGSIQGAIRVTEQGEMIRFKFGLEAIAIQHLEIYCAATLKATLLPPPKPKAEWRTLMDSMTSESVQVYRQTVREHPDFVRYLRTVTPELELQMLPLGSRPAKRKVSGGVESLRAIPWVFAWTQIRLMLPAWLGTGAALKQALQNQQKATLEEMLAEWPYFQTLIDMLEMVLSKADVGITQYYENHLTDDPALVELGQHLRALLGNAIETLLQLKTQSELLTENEVLDQSMRVRKTYLLPLHLLQAELMRRRRDYMNQGQSQTPVDHALMVTIAGIAAGLRNTG
ncbi:phosphoenolpyruvate carboxylase [Acinetobacter sp. c3-l95]|uniref:phosphoenolpyruvate carboxylase n=1 Tax=Acinetobacter sp. c3-l95 TaxID=3342804 RepID=UPI0035B87E07